LFGFVSNSGVARSTELGPGACIQGGGSGVVVGGGSGGGGGGGGVQSTLRLCKRRDAINGTGPGCPNQKIRIDRKIA